MKRIAALTMVLAASACGHVSYEDTKPGEFQGNLFVMWVGEGDGSAGDGRFLFVPDPHAPLVFTWTDPQGKTRDLQPRMMYTDGGSIPKFVQVFKGFSPWGYAPAYMVHDWLYTARHCNRDGQASPAEAEVADITFQQSADILASAIKTLTVTGRVAKDDVAASTISDAVAGPIAWRVWDKAGACEKERVREPHRLAAETAIPGSSQALRRAGVEAGVAPATIVGIIGF